MRFPKVEVTFKDRHGNIRTTVWTAATPAVLKEMIEKAKNDSRNISYRVIK